ncbi:MAG TPA: hypothetical protein PK937_15890 [bacterium]|nr:hypothetical protein [bacterium]
MVKTIIGFFIGVLLTLGVQNYLTKGDEKNEITIDEKLIDSLDNDTKRDFLEERARSRKERKKDMGKND